MDLTTLPRAICKSCKTKLSAALPFIKLTRESAKTWNKTTEYLTHYQVPENTKNLYLIFDDKGMETLADNIRCPTLPSTSEANVLKNLKNRLYRHKAYSKRRKKLKLTQDTDLKCPECSICFIEHQKFNYHLRLLGKRSCTHCHGVFHVKQLKNHMENEHKIKTYSCKTCSEPFELQIALQKHMRSNHKNDAVFCILCKKSFATQSRLVAHMPYHNPQTCLGCNKIFTSKYCFKNHNCPDRTLKQEKYICDYCSSEYNTKAKLRTHIVHQHLVGKLNQCDKCGKRFLTSFALEEHGNTHDKVSDRFVCDICDRKYSTRRGYEKHITKHFGDISCTSKE